MHIFFESPFWVGLFELVEHEELTVCHVVFGKEPKDYEVYAYVMKNYDRLVFSPPIAITDKETHRNPKRMQREVRKQMNKTDVGTKSQQAMKLRQEEHRVQRKQRTHKEKEEHQKQVYTMKQQKRKDRHRGK